MATATSRKKAKTPKTYGAFGHVSVKKRKGFKMHDNSKGTVLEDLSSLSVNAILPGLDRLSEPVKPVTVTTAAKYKTRIREIEAENQTALAIIRRNNDRLRVIRSRLRGDISHNELCYRLRKIPKVKTTL